MAVYLDNEAWDLEAADLGSALVMARHKLEGSGRVIVEVQVDGESVVGEDLARRSNDPISESDVHLCSAEPRELAVTALEQARQHLQVAGQLQLQSAELLQQDRQVEALERLADAIEIWQRVHHALVGSAQLLSLALDDITVDDRPIGASIDQLIEQLKAVVELIRNRDTVALADALAYEWPAMLEQWDRLIAAVIDRVET